MFRMWILLFSILLSSCSTVSVDSLDRRPAEDTSCLDIVQNIIQPKPLDENAVKYDNYFKLKASPYYQTEWETNARHYIRDFWELKKKGSPEIELFEKLGFQVFEDKIIVPNLETFITRYRDYLNLKKIPEDSRIMPAMTSIRKSDEKVIMHNPLLPWQGNLAEYTPKVGLRLKGRDIAESLASGLFPVFKDGFHDVFHFITFALHPDYAKRLRIKNKALAKLKLNSSILNRNAYSLEALTLANPAKTNDILHVITPKNVTSTTKLKGFQDEIEKLSEDELKAKVEFWSKNYKKYLTAYSGGMAEPKENSIYREMMSGEDNFAKYLLNHFSDEFFSPSYNKIMPNEILYDGMTYMDTALAKISTLSQEKINQIFSRTTSKKIPNKNELMKLQLARIEYALWKSATTINYQRWLEDTLKDSVDNNSATMLFIKDCFGENSHIYKLFQSPVVKTTPDTGEQVLKSSSGIQVKGNFTTFKKNDQGEIFYYGTKGPTELLYEGVVIPGQGVKQHAQGFSSPLGKLKGVSKAIEDLNAEELNQLGIIAGEEVTLEYVSGVVVTGKLKSILTRNNKNIIFIFEDSTAEVTGPDGTLYFERSWGTYDMVIGSQFVEKVPADF